MCDGYFKSPPFIPGFQTIPLIINQFIFMFLPKLCTDITSLSERNDMWKLVKEISKSLYY